MANFVDGRKFLSISGQLIHVPLRGSIHVGLRRGFALDGTPLMVEADSPGVIRILPGRNHGVRMFTLIGVDIGDTILQAVAKDGGVLARVEVHVHRPRTRQLPRFDDLFENYAGDEESSDDFRRRDPAPRLIRGSRNPAPRAIRRRTNSALTGGGKLCDDHTPPPSSRRSLKSKMPEPGCARGPELAVSTDGRRGVPPAVHQSAWFRRRTRSLTPVKPEPTRSNPARRR